MQVGEGRPIAPLVLSAEERAYLERQVRRHRVARSLSERCRGILRCADGLASRDVAAELGHHERLASGVADFCTIAAMVCLTRRPGRPRTIDDDQVAAVIERTLRTTPLDATHWSIRSMAAETGFSHTTIRANCPGGATSGGGQTRADGGLRRLGSLRIET